MLDYEANTPSSEDLRRTFPEFIRILRVAHPLTPILAVSQIAFAFDAFQPAAYQERLERKAIQQDTVRTLRAQGDAAIFFYDGYAMLGSDGDACTVDGIHPTDLGFQRIADALEPVLGRILR